MVSIFVHQVDGKLVILMRLSLYSDYTISEKDIQLLTCCCLKCYSELYPSWLLYTQHTVSQIICHYYQLPKEQRTCLRILQLIEKKWPKKVQLFESKKHYYQILLAVTDTLLRLLPVGLNQENFIVFNHTDTWDEEVDVQLRLHYFLLAFPSCDSYILRKYVVFHHPVYIESLYHMFRYFCYRHLHGLSGQIEIINVLDGSVFKRDLNNGKIQTSLDYIRLMKEVRYDDEKLYRMIQ